MAVKPIPEGYHTVTTYLAVENAAEAIDYYKRAFGAQEKVRMDAPGGKIGHAELQIGDSIVMLSDPFPQATVKPPKEIGGTSASVFMYVDDVDSVVKKAVRAVFPSTIAFVARVVPYVKTSVRASSSPGATPSSGASAASASSTL